MNNNYQFTNDKVEEYLNFLRKRSLADRQDKNLPTKLATLYRDYIHDDQTTVLLYDDRKSQIFYADDNLNKTFYHHPKTLINAGNLALFNLIEPSHHSFLFKSIKYACQFCRDVKANTDTITTIQFHYGGLKFLDGNNNLRRVFMRVKPLIWDENNCPDISLVLMQDITHLTKGDNYWLRFVSQKHSFAYIEKEGKKEFPDLLSESELKVLSLLAEKKTSQEIAQTLFLSKLTIETHRKNMLKKTGIFDSTALIHLCKMMNIL